MPATMTVDVESDGWFVLSLRGADGAAKEVRLDLLRANSALAKFADEHAADDDGQAEAWAKYLAECGCPPLARGAALKVAEAVVAEAQKLYGTPAAPARAG